MFESVLNLVWNSIDPFSAIATAAVINSLRYVISRHDKDSSIQLDFQCKWQFSYSSQQYFFVGLLGCIIYTVSLIYNTMNFWPYVPFSPSYKRSFYLVEDRTRRSALYLQMYIPTCTSGFDKTIMSFVFKEMDWKLDNIYYRLARSAFLPFSHFSYFSLLCEKLGSVYEAEDELIFLPCDFDFLQTYFLLR